MGAIYKVRSSPTAKILMGLKKQAIIEDAVKRAEAASIGQDLLVVLQINDLPLRLLIQPKNHEIAIVTNEEAEQCGVMKLQDVRQTDRN